MNNFNNCGILPLHINKSKNIRSKTVVDFTSADVERLLEGAEYFVPEKDRWLVFYDRILYYGSITWPIILTSYLFIALKKQNEVFYASPSTLVLILLKFFWFSGIVFIVTNLLGLFFGGAPEAKNQKNKMAFKSLRWPEKTLVICWVSRGQNYLALERAIIASLPILRKLGVKYEIEIVTDIEVSQHHKEISGERDVIYVVVPEGYQTERKALYKARALHHALELRKERHAINDHEYWILHLDEESRVTESLIYGVAKFIGNPENKSTIGQGEIKYNGHGFGSNLLITAIDSVRTGDDLGRFRMQFGLAERPLFGMHGSFILCPEEIENEVGFDLGGKGSITEDAYFALTAQERGVKFGWVDGHITEQSPFTLKELLKQRKRWIQGLGLLAKDTILCKKTRLPLMLNLLLWRMSFVGSVATILNVALGGTYFPEWALFLASITLGVMISVYTVGAYRNLIDEKEDCCTTKKIFLYFLPAFLIFYIGIIEGIAVLWSFFSPIRGFDVVAKN